MITTGDREGTAEAVRDEERSLVLHEHMFSKRPIFGRLAGIGPADDRQLVARSIQGGRTMVVVHLRR